MISIGFSPCPNDTFIFYALVNKKIDVKGIDINPVIEDVETLNRLAIKKALDVTKISCHAFYYLQDNYNFLRSGGAFGRGCGPLLVADKNFKFQISNFKFQNLKIAIPGELTTAFLLLNLYLSSPQGGLRPKGSSTNSSLSFIAMPFYEIINAVSEGKADAGLIIHESRFTYPDYGLEKVIDLGDWWEKETGLPIPLGGIIAKKSLGMPAVKTIESLIRASVEYSMLHRDEVMPYIKQYSQELSEDVVMKHISLYVNDYTIDIGAEGENALRELFKKARKINLCLHP
ncbi:MAG: 1,4-dihydroxy-6-naphthoate synthase [Nitrospirae bacterium]|nr:1,4-dihydroxy-6-naphthoate synthase [Nitrospirota bacterium]